MHSMFLLNASYITSTCNHLNFYLAKASCAPGHADSGKEEIGYPALLGALYNAIILDKYRTESYIPEASAE